MYVWWVKKLISFKLIFKTSTHCLMEIICLIPRTNIKFTWKILELFMSNLLKLTFMVVPWLGFSSTLESLYILNTSWIQTLKSIKIKYTMWEQRMNSLFKAMIEVNSKLLAPSFRPPTQNPLTNIHHESKDPIWKIGIY